MKKKNLMISAVSACILFSSGFCFADDAESVSFYEAGFTCEDTVSVSRDIWVDYSTGTWQMDYHFENTGSESTTCTVDVPDVTTLEKANEEFYTFSAFDSENNPADFMTDLYFTPILSSSGISESNVTETQLRGCASSEISLPEDEGTIYTLTAPSASEEAVDLFTLSTLTDESCRIYPIHCTYTKDDSSYRISSAKNASTCYLFLTGSKDVTYSLESYENSGFTVVSESSSLDEFMELSCRIYLEENKLGDLVNQELLVRHLSNYLNSSTVTVSLDLISSLQWLVKQELFQVSSCSITVLPGQTSTISIVRNCELPVNEVSVNPILTASGADLTSDTIHIPLFDDYTRASLRPASGKFDTETSSITLKKSPDETFRVLVSKTPIWEKAYRYIVPMCIVMVLFLGLCVISFLQQKKRGAAKAEVSDDKKRM